MNILHITSITNPKGNGVAVAVKNYIKYESKYANVGVYNLEDEITENFCQNYDYKKYKKIKELPKPFNKPDLVIFNEVYKPKYINLYKECVKRKIKYIIIPHGCLVTESQKKNKLKKLIGNTLLFNKFIYKANAIQFLNDNEKNNSNFKYKKNIIAGNGVEKATHKNTNKGKNKTIVFIGRYNIKIKGLDILCKICQKNYNWFKNNNVKIVLYGRDTLKNLKQLKNIVKKQNIEDIFIINDAIYGKDKENVLKNAYAFIQCSRHEGQPLGILEALSYGLPCIITYNTSLGTYVNDKKCGIGCQLNDEIIFQSIKKICNDYQLRNNFSKNAKINIEKDYIWKNIIKKTIKEYEGIVNDI